MQSARLTAMETRRLKTYRVHSSDHPDRLMPPSRLDIVRLLLLAAMLVLSTMPPASAQPRDTVVVGGYAFPPYVELASDARPSGLTLDVLEILNRSQERYDFRFFLTTPTRRYQDFEAGRFDAILFEMPEWGWQGHAVEVSRQFATDGEVYVALAADGRGEGFFDDVGAKRIAAILGYNYGFAGFRNDPAELGRRFDIALVNDHGATVELVLRGRVEVGVVTESFLDRHLAAHPADRPRLLISQRRDQVYSHRVLARPGLAPSAEQIAMLILQADAAGRLTALWQRYGLRR